MPQLVTIPFRLTPQREATLRRELKLGPDVRLTSIMAHYAIRDTVYAWLDGHDEPADLTEIATITEDELGERRAFTVSDRPYQAKKPLKIRPKKATK